MPQLRPRPNADLILMRRSVIVEVLSLRLNDERPVFTRVARFVDDISHIRMLSGYMLGFGVHRDRSLPSLLNWKTGDVFNLVGAPDVKVCDELQWGVSLLMPCREAR